MQRVRHRRGDRRQHRLRWQAALQASTEHRQGPERVGTVTVDPTINQALQAIPQRREKHRHDPCRQQGQRRSTLHSVEHRAQPGDHRDVDADHADRQHHVQQGAVDQPVDVEQPVPQDRHRRRNRNHDREHLHDNEDPRIDLGCESGDDRVDNERDGRQCDRVRQPGDLLAFDLVAAPESQNKLVVDASIRDSQSSPGRKSPTGPRSDRAVERRMGCPIGHPAGACRPV